MMKRFDENYVLLEEMEKDSYFPDFLVEEVRETLRPVIRLLEGGERDTEVIQEKLDEAVRAINDLEEGYYVLMNFSADPAFPAELDRLMRINVSVMRSIIVAKEG